jgi:murein L,D-transpeptidase YafK
MRWLFIFLMAVSPVFGDVISGVDRVAVYKKKRMLQLCRGDSVLKVYQIALGKEPQGHKTREGDSRTPEGRYVLDWRNPESRYHLSIHISYPSDKDKKRADSLGVEPGGDIMIHGYPEGVSASMWSRYWFLGRDWTDGCIAVSNEAMEEIWGSVENGTMIDIYP